MKIYSDNKGYYKPVFKTYSVKKTNGTYPYYTTTQFFRNDLNWDEIVYRLNSFYKNVPKVNVICHACSDGEEPYSLALKLISVLGKGAEKFFPIQAKDIDYENIALAKKGYYQLTDREFDGINYHGGVNLGRYLDIADYGDYGKYAKVKDALKEKVCFESIDILDDIKNIPRENTVLFCRNFLPYLPDDLQDKIIEMLRKQLKVYSLILIGSFDQSYGVHEKFKNFGFDTTDMCDLFLVNEPVSLKSVIYKKLQDFSKNIFKKL